MKITQANHNHSAFVLFLLLFSCSIEPQPIDYGNDACHYCKMNIVDRQRAAEIVTQKGKTFKYDSIECMIRDSRNREQSQIALFLVSDYSSPGKFINASGATYLISENLPSPMGANLSGFASKSDAVKVQLEKKGTLYSWGELKNMF